VFTNIKLTCNKKDYRTAIVLDDVHDSKFISTTINEPAKKKALHEQKTSGIIFNK